MAQACPVNFTTMDDTVSRIVSALTALAVAGAAFFSTEIPLCFVAADLLVRLYGNSRFSPLFRLALRIRDALGLPERRVDGAAKKVAGHFGLFFLLMLILTPGLPLWHLGILTLFLFCLFLDVVTGFCVGCRIYHLWRMVRA